MAKKITEMLPPDVDHKDMIYIVDKNLKVVYSNDEWQRFASANNGGIILTEGWNANLLENMKDKERKRWKHIYRLLLEGRVPYHKENFICSSPFEKRIYQLRITPRREDNGNVAWFVHHAFRIDEKEYRLNLLGRHLRKLNDPNRVTQEYQKRIIERAIRIPRYRAARHLRPLEDIGGDLIWHREFPKGVTHLAIADAVGHGDSAGQLATQMSIILDEVADADNEPSATISALNRAMMGLAPDNDVIFATGLLFRFDHNKQHLTCSNFGHHNPIFSHTGQLVVDGGPPVGLAEEMRPWPDTQIDIVKHGHRFLAFSDGITEQFNISGEMFGTVRLLRAFQKHLELPLDNMLAKIVEELNRFRRSALVKDDQTLLAIEFVGGK
jgi:serine phosphatase RsbU (regulator of sigma subunit)